MKNFLFILLVLVSFTASAQCRVETDAFTSKSYAISDKVALVGTDYVGYGLTYYQEVGGSFAAMSLVAIQSSIECVTDDDTVVFLFENKGERYSIEVTHMSKFNCEGLFTIPVFFGTDFHTALLSHNLVGIRTSIGQDYFLTKDQQLLFSRAIICVEYARL